MTNSIFDSVSAHHPMFELFESKMVKDVWESKYRWKDETFNDMCQRIVKGVYSKDTNKEERQKAFDALRNLLWIPGGRIMAGAGTEKRVTLMNCYVNDTLEDSMEGIMQALTNAALTLQQGGGIGTDFSTLRPEGALLKRTHTKASGPMPFMHMWDRASATIRSAGDRRGAMMGTMIDTHPDLPKFITSKHSKNVLTQFNISVLVSDAFMAAIRDNEEWVLHFHVEPVSRDLSLQEFDFEDENGIKQYAYSIWKARDLWEMITKSTYEYSEPGVIFIDRVNELNNLWYCEKISCTNPCGEQPLPPHGTCNLGHVNLSRCVKDPFTAGARIDYDLIHEVVRVGVRFLDNVIDVTQYPLPSQELEEVNKRRLGLGYTGLADMLSQLGIRYGSPEAVRIVEEVTRYICLEAYNASIDLAIERGSFPLFKVYEYLNGSNFASVTLPDYVKQKIAKHGIRNALLLTIAPTGTGSIIAGNVSSGCEPTFKHISKRKVLKSEGFTDEWETYIEYGYAAGLYKKFTGLDTLPSYMVEAEDLTVDEHVIMQSASQRWLDSSISKTINVPKDISYESFLRVYDLAYTLGCKGCTTYRPSDIRGSILSSVDDKPHEEKKELIDRPDTLEGKTYKIKWPSLHSAIYLTINSLSDGTPFEIFLTSKDARYHDWTTALTVMISAIFRKGGDISFVAKELQQIQSLSDGTFKDGKYHSSLIAYIGFVLDNHINHSQDFSTANENLKEIEGISIPHLKIENRGEKCPQCNQFAYVRKEGCRSCISCGFTTCG